MSRSFLLFLAAAALILTLGAGWAAADPTVNPNHPVYDAVESWQVEGIVDRVPSFRPYPAHELRRILETVASTGSAADRDRAAEYLRLVAEEQNLEWWGTGRAFTRDDEVQPKAGIGLGANGTLVEGAKGSFVEGLDYGASVGAFAIERGAEDLLPKGERSQDDVLEDNAKVTVGGRDIYTLLQISTQTTFHREGVFLQAGIMRRSFGPFHNESPVVSSDAPQTGNFVFEWQRPRFRYNAALFTMTATRLFRERESIDPTENRQIDLNGDGIADFVDKPENVPGKHLFLHSFMFDVAPWLDVGVYEAILFGPRLELTYFVPLKFLWHAQGIANFFDNSLIGLSAEIKPAARWRLPMTVYVDDASFNDLAQFNFDTKYKLTAATAVQWAPPVEQIRTVALSYEAVLPYMYTHSVTNPYTGEANYLNYLHQGQNLGTGLLPNSDRLALEATFAPVRRVSVGLRGAMIRHANASEGILDQYLNDGSYTDSGKSGEFVTFGEDEDGDGSPNNEAATWLPGELTYNDKLRFMDQDHIEMTYQAGVEVTLTPVTGPFRWDVILGYTYEYVDGRIEYRWDPADAPAGGETVSVGDEVNHYGEIQVKVSY